jgi:hypothetical protein
MTDLSITVPSACAERFRREVFDDLRSSAENVQEGLDWQREAKGDPQRLDGDLARYTESDRLFAQVRHPSPGDLTVSASQPLLAGLMRMAILGCVEDLQQAVDERGTVDDVRTILSAFGCLLDVIDQYGLSTAAEMAEDDADDD